MVIPLKVPSFCETIIHDNYMHMQHVCMHAHLAILLREIQSPKAYDHVISLTKSSKEVLL